MLADAVSPINGTGIALYFTVLILDYAFKISAVISKVVALAGTYFICLSPERVNQPPPLPEIDDPSGTSINNLSVIGVPTTSE